ncbi:MAG: efflux RND transporter permease subunit [Fimbriiglobus sp.]
MFARTFIDRPVLAWVVSIVIVLFGLAAFTQLPVEQYPQIAPPTIQVTAVYPGANAQIVAQTVAAPIEQQVNGVENMLYMSSTSANDGTYTLTVTFKLGTDLNMAQVLIQNRVQLATPQVPPEVQRQGLNVKKQAPDVLLVVNVLSPDSSRDAFYLSNYSTVQIVDELARVEGVGDVLVFGRQDYTMKAWLDPDKLSANNLTAPEVVTAIQNQNIQVAAGQVGAEPAPKGTQFTYTMNALGRLTTEEQFGEIVVKIGAPVKDSTGGSIRPAVRLRDIGRVELTSRNESVTVTSNAQPTIGMAIFQLPGTNALDTRDGVIAKMDELKQRFPTGVDYTVRYDTTPFVRQSVDEVFHTLRDAIILVAIVVLLFLQDWRAMILPLIDVPVSLIGTLAVMYLFGFTINNLTLFGLVLAIGIVVDDAIVVLENVERWIAKGYDSRTATLKAMSEITGPIIAITLVLSAVFIPSALLPGITGQFYRQFALTIASAMVISAINAMTLTPSRAAAIFKDRGGEHGHHNTETLPWYGWAVLFGYISHLLLASTLAEMLKLKPENDLAAIAVQFLYAVPGLVVGALVGRYLNRGLGVFYRGFNWAFDQFALSYRWFVKILLYGSPLVLIGFCGLLYLTYHYFTTTPAGFIPTQDKGYLVVAVALPDASSVQRTREVVKQIDTIARETPGAKDTVCIIGQSLILGATGSNFATIFVTLDDFENRKHDRTLSAFGVLMRLQGKLTREVQDAQVAVFPPPPVSGLGTTGGFKVMVEDRQDAGPLELEKQVNGILQASRTDPNIGFAFTLYRARVPQLYVKLNRARAMQMGVPLNSVFSTLQIYLGSAYVNDFNRDGRTWQVTAQADARFRVTSDMIRNLKVKTDQGEMVPLGSVCEIQDDFGPVTIQRYNMYSSAAINGSFPPTVSTGQGIAAVEELGRANLPRSFATEWTELSYLQNLEGKQAIYAFLGAVILVYLVLAGQYNSWTLPLAVILVVPMCLLCAVIGVRQVGGDMNIFTQVGFVVLVGLASKNAILIVEFAQQLREQGRTLKEATLESCQLRLRPIVMTSFAFILGVVPLLIATGAGAEMRRALGIAVFSGMIGVTFFGVLLTPVFYYVIERLKGDHPKPATPEHETPKA